MKTYRVTRKVTIEYYHEVKANSKQQAIDIAYEYGEFTNRGSNKRSITGGRHSVKAVIIE
jgi:hypothetical protein